MPRGLRLRDSLHVYYSLAETLTGNRTGTCLILMLWYHCTMTKLVWADRCGSSGDLVRLCSGQIITTTAVFFSA